MGKARKMGWFMEYRCLLGGDWNMNGISHDFPFNWEWNNHPNWLELHHFSEGQVYHQPGLVDMGGCWWISDIRDIDVLGLIRLRQSLTYIYIYSSIRNVTVPNPGFLLRDVVSTDHDMTSKNRVPCAVRCLSKITLW